ncbi:large conductance mechanosensitive channel protein MscL [Fodinibius salsisoli]
MWKEFKEFAIKGNVIDMAVGIIIGAAFTSVVQSLVKDVLLPALSPITGSIDFSSAFLVIKPGATPGPYESLQVAKEAGATILSYGTFINASISFFLVAFAVFVLVKNINRLKRPEEKPAPEIPKIKECTYCFTEIPVKASRCPHCTSQLEES